MIKGEFTAISKARELQRAASINVAPVQIEKYLAAAGAEVQVRFDLAEEEAGQCLEIGSRRIIWVNGNHSPQRQRFTILHELGHLWLNLPSTHGQALSVDALLRYSHKPAEEILCDIFAAECLFPHPFFGEATRLLSCSMQSISKLAEDYDASLTATGSRFAAYNTESCAWILVDDGHIRYSSCSPPLRERGFWVPLGIEVPKLSVLGRALAGAGNEKADVVPSHVWTNSTCRGVEEFYEEVVLIPSLSQGLVLLSAEEAEPMERARPGGDSAEDELLPELDGNLQFGKRSRRK